MTLPSIEQLKRALHLQETIARLQHELGLMFGKAGAKVLGFATSGMKAATRGIKAIKLPRKKPKFSKAARKAIADGQRRRWAKVKSNASGTVKAKKPAKKKRTISASHRAAIVKAQKARWSKFNKAKAKAVKPKAKKRGRKAMPVEAVASPTT